MKKSPLIDIRPFCATRASRYVLTLPHFSRGRWYATDGHIIVRIQPDRCTEGDPPDEQPSFPKVWTLPWRNHRRLVSLPRRRKGRDLGMGESPSTYVTTVVGVHIKMGYYDMLRGLPCVRVARTPYKSTCETLCGLLYFTFDGGRGLVAGIKIC